MKRTARMSRRLHWNHEAIATRPRPSGAVSTKSEGKGLESRILKLDFELSIDDGPILANELIKARFSHNTVAAFVGVPTVCGTRWRAVNRHPKANGGAGWRWPHDEVDIARVKTAGDATRWTAEHGSFLFHRIDEVQRRPVVIAERPPD